MKVLKFNINLRSNQFNCNLPRFYSFFIFRNTKFRHFFVVVAVITLCTVWSNTTWSSHVWSNFTFSDKQKKVKLLKISKLNNSFTINKEHFKKTNSVPLTAMEKLELMLQLAPMEKIGTNTIRDTKESPFLLEMHRAGLHDWCGQKIHKSKKDRRFHFVQFYTVCLLYFYVFSVCTGQPSDRQRYKCTIEEFLYLSGCVPSNSSTEVDWSFHLNPVCRAAGCANKVL